MGRAGETPASPQPLELEIELCEDPEKGREEQEVTYGVALSTAAQPPLAGEGTYRSWWVLSPDEAIQYEANAENHARVQCRCLEARGARLGSFI